MEHSPDQGGVYAASVVLLVAATLAVGLRVKVRRMKDVQFGADDYTIFVALAFVYSLAVVLIYGAAEGTLGTHTALDPVTGEILTTWHEQQASELSVIFMVLSIVTYGSMKISVLLLYRRIFVGKIFNVASWIVGAITVAWTIAFLFAVIFQCGEDPTRNWRSKASLKKYCSDYKYIWLGHSVSDVAIDLLVLSVPIPIIARLHVSISQKLALSFVFLLGLLSTAAGTARIVFVAEDYYETTTGARDLRGISTNVMVWGYVEGAVGVIAACLPTLRPIARMRMVDSIINSLQSVLSIRSGSTTHRGQDARKRSDTDTGDAASESYELAERRLYTGPNGAVEAHVIGASLDGAPPQLPESAIVAQTKITMNEDERPPR